MMPEGGDGTAEQLKAEGNEQHKNKDYRAAINSYTAAIELSPQNFTLYGNRSASHINLGNFSDALEDAHTSTNINNEFIKGYLRQIKCHIALGQAALAQNVEQRLSQMGIQLSEEEKKMKQACDKDIQALTTFEASARKASESEDYRQAAYFFEQCSLLAPGCTAYKILKAESVAKLGRYTEATELASDVVRREKMNADAIFVLALCHYYQDNMEKALTLLGEVLRQAPDHSKSMKTYKLVKRLSKMKEEGNEAFKKGDYDKAYQLYTDALQLDPHNKTTNAKLYCNRANAGSKLKKVDQSIKDCDRAIQLDENYEKAYLRRAKLLQEAERFDEAVRDCEHIYKKNPTPANKQAVREAKLELKKSKRKDYYKLLGVDKNASDEEIKKAYKKLALIHHPDRHQTDVENEKLEHERKFKEIGEAYAVLSDKVKRQKYDSGQDLEDFDGAGGFHDIDPTQIFQMFFSGGGAGEGHPFMGGGGPGGRRHHHHSFGGGPGMHFSFQTS